MQDRQHVGQVPARLHEHSGAAGDRQHRPEKAEQDQHDEGDDVVRDRLHADGEHSERLQEPVVLEVAGQPAEQVADRPGDDHGGGEQADGPRQRPPHQPQRRRREGEQRRAHVAAHQAAPETQELTEQRLVGAVQLGERRAHRFLRLGAEAGLPGQAPHGLLHRVERRQVSDEEGRAHSQEHHQQQLPEPLQREQTICSHGRVLPRTVRLPDPCQQELFVVRQTPVGVGTGWATRVTARRARSGSGCSARWPSW